MVMRQLRIFFTALQFFTRLPIPSWVGFDPEWVRASARFFPLIGIGVGAVAAILLLVVGQAVPITLAVLLSTVGTICLTGALHEDGFADACDGFGGGHTPQKIIDIMRDPRIGAFGAIGIGLLLAIKVVTLASMSLHCAAWALLLAHPLSRLAATMLIWRMRYAAADGKASIAVQPMSSTIFVVASLPVVVLFVIVLFNAQIAPLSMLVSGVAVLICTAWLARTFQHRLGGYTGDCLGAVQQLTEAVFYLGVLVTQS